ncbi:MAG: hypothetical protein ABJN42_08590 [Roseibium sp.]|uniref:hypothetical protein n=1 Tax=Roseibium sp. TaxID=1936156 RepID=UPI003299AE2F
MSIKKPLATAFLTAFLAMPSILPAQSAEGLELVVSQDDVNDLHDLLVEISSAQDFQVMSWHDMDQDGVPEAFVVEMPDENGNSPWSLYVPTIDGPRVILADSADEVSLIEPDADMDAAVNVAHIKSGNITWILTEDGPMPADDLIEQRKRTVTSPTASEEAFLAHMGYPDMIPSQVDVYRMNFIPGKGGDRVIVMKAKRFLKEDGSWPYLILDDYNRILLSGRSVNHPYIFTAKGDPIEIVEVRDGGIRIRKLRSEKLQ